MDPLTRTIRQAIEALSWLAVGIGAIFAAMLVTLVVLTLWHHDLLTLALLMTSLVGLLCWSIGGGTDRRWAFLWGFLGLVGAVAMVVTW